MDKDKKYIKVETIIGKESYLFAVEHLLKYATKVLHNQKWSIVTMDENILLPTTDNPVVFLNFNSMKDYNLKGAWNTSKTNILFPISPNKLLFCQIGEKCPHRFTFDKEMSEFIKKVVVENAYKIVISKEQDMEIPILRERTINKDLFLSERKSWDTFQQNYIEEESKYIRNKGILSNGKVYLFTEKDRFFIKNMISY